MSTATVWVRGRPVRGFFFGLLMGLGGFLLMTTFKLIPIDTMPLVVTVLGGALVGLIRGLVGRPYKVTLQERGSGDTETGSSG